VPVAATRPTPGARRGQQEGEARSDQSPPRR
jgi:hypothetical protein